jgi:hypothetical protein
MILAMSAPVIPLACKANRLNTAAAALAVLISSCVFMEISFKHEPGHDP